MSADNDTQIDSVSVSSDSDESAGWDSDRSKAVASDVQVVSSSVKRGKKDCSSERTTTDGNLARKFR